MPPLLADFIYSSDCKLICEKSLTLPFETHCVRSFYRILFWLIIALESENVQQKGNIQAKTPTYLEVCGRIDNYGGIIQNQCFSAL